MDTSTATTEPIPRLVNGIPAERHAQYSFDATPCPVIFQGLTATRDVCPQLRKLRKFCDPGAGSGAFGMVARRVFGSQILSVAIEPREEELPHLRRHYDAVYIDTMQACAEIPRGADFDLISTNPKFEIWHEVVPWALDRLAPDGVLSLYGRTYWGHSKEPAERSDLFKKYPPLITMRVGGRTRHRVGRNEDGKPFATDSHKYSWWVWDKSRPGIPGVRIQIDLPQLEPHELRFTTIPGQEPDEVEEDAAE